MSRSRSIRAITAFAVALGGLLAAVAAGAPLIAGLVALLAGIAAFAIAPALGAPPPPPPRLGDEAPAGPLLPDIADVLGGVDEPRLIVRERRVLLANPAAKAMLGDHIEGVDVRLAIRHPAAAERLAARAGEGAERFTRIDLVGLGDPGRRWEMTTALLGDGSRLVRLTDRSQSHAAERMRVDFVANASHELRTPLATLLGFIETLQDDETAGDPKLRARFLGIMADEASRMRRLVDDLLSLSRIEAERYSPPREPVAVEPLLAEVADSLAALIEKRDSTLLVDPEESGAVVAGDRPQLCQLFINLVTNALTYGRAGTPVRVRIAAADPALIRIDVIDLGEGIAAEHLPRLTERFYRVDAGRSRAVGGTGLGLAIVKHIVGRHRGRLAIRSCPGEGTTVSVYLPRAPRAETGRE